MAHGLYTKSNSTKVAAYNLFIISTIGAGIAYFTGEAAEESVENIQGVLEQTMEAHEEFALFALVSLVVLGLASVAGLYLTLTKSLMTRSAAIIILAISIFSFGLVARTGYLGGQIRHTELVAGATLPADTLATEEEED